MKKTLLTLAVFTLTLMGAQASVVINSTNFPDENLRNYASQYDEDGNGTLSDEELAQITEINAGDILNLKGAEHFKNLEFLCLWYGSTENPSIASIDPSLFPKLYRFSLQDCGGVTALDFSKNPLLTDFEMLRCPNTSSVTLPTSVEEIVLDGMTKLTTLSVSQLPNLRLFHMCNSGITDLNFSANPALSSVSITGNEDQKQVLNSLNLENCNGLENVDIRYTTIKTLTMKHLPFVRSLMLLNNDVTSTTIDDCAEFNDITCDQNVLGTLYLTNNPELEAINCENNQLQVLIAYNCPRLGHVQAFNNRLMWLDLKDVVKNYAGDTMLRLDNQQPTVQAVKISPTETGLLVHERFDVTRVLNLRAKGLSQTARETTVDGIRYFVFYNNGPDTPNLVGSDCYYEYETKWPYPWVEENSKDNNLPVTLNVTSWTKHQAFIRLSTTDIIRGEYGQPAPTAPTVTRSQDYNGKLTWKSSNEKVVKVNADTGELTVIGAGTAIITISGAETDYRLAPASITYTVVIDKATPTFSFEKATMTVTLGETVPQNPLSIGLYDGTVAYSSSNEDVATVSAEGVVTTKALGETVIAATGAETQNCYEARSAQYTLTISEATGIGDLSSDPSSTGEAGKAFDLSGRRVVQGNNVTSSQGNLPKGIYIVNGRKTVVK